MTDDAKKKTGQLTQRPQNRNNSRDEQAAHNVSAACELLRRTLLEELARGTTHGQFGVMVTFHDGRLHQFERIQHAKTRPT